MGKFIAVWIAGLQYASGIYIFKKPDVSGCGPWLASVLVLFSLGLVLWNLPLYPAKLRKLIWMGNSLAEYLVAVFLIEQVMGSFWFPLEAAVLAALPTIGLTLEGILLRVNIMCHTPCQFFKWEATGFFVSYSLSIIILIAAMHATRMFNLKLLTWGISPFMKDISRRFQKFLKKTAPIVGINCFRPRRQRPDSYVPDEEEDVFNFDVDQPGQCAPEDTTDNNDYYYTDDSDEPRCRRNHKK